MKMETIITRMDIFQVDLPERDGSVQSGKRPAIIISNNKNNDRSPIVNIIPLTTKDKMTDKEQHYPMHIFIGIENGVDEPSFALCEQDTTISKRRLLYYIGHCNKETMQRLESGIMLQKGIKERPSEPFNINKCYKLVKSILNAQRIIDTFGIYKEETFFVQTLEDELKSYCLLHGKSYSKVFNTCSQYISTPEYSQKIAVCR